jgi:23S rRNA (cytosine1962-C5)-methyltransferase
LERFGEYFFVRPYEDAVWSKTLTKEMQKIWKNADGKFWSSKVGAKAGWKMSKGIFAKWEMQYKGIKFLASPTPFRHLGFFPEQSSHWNFIEEKIKEAKSARGGQVKFLNLFGYTGVASLFALRAGAEVTHIDASKQSLSWAKENQELNGFGNLPMRIICDDALKFLEREEKRGNKYDAVIMDPPKHGRGPKGEVWKIEDMLPKLLSQVKKVLSDKPIFIILTSYAVDSSSLSLGYALSETMKDLEGNTEAGELCVLEKSNSRAIPLANTAVWNSLLT